MRTTHHVVWATTSIAAIFTVSSMLTAGPLDPPPGPVAATGKTLDEVEPRIPVNAINTPGGGDGFLTTPSLFKITRPGSYYLESNITGVAGMSGIEITSSGVTLDLSGFDMQGVVGSHSGVITLNSSTNIRIHNGSVRDWGESGVAMSLARNSVLRDLTATDNGLGGLGIGGGSLVENCIARGNGRIGISASFGGATVRACTASSNTSHGILTGVASTVTGCMAQSNGRIGIAVNAGSVVSGCTTLGNGLNGIATGTSATISNCTAKGNRAGISIDERSTISGCTASGNVEDGIRAAGRECSIINNACYGNGFDGGGAGIRVTNGPARVEGNAVAGNDIGIRTAGNCFVAKNTASRNGVANYDIADGATFGPIVSVTGDLSRTDAGHHPWANFSF